MKKKLSLLIFILVHLFNLTLFAQSTSWFMLPKPSGRITDGLNQQCSIRKVKTRKNISFEKGKPVVNSITTFGRDGRIMSEKKNGYYKNSMYYSYSGDTTVIRTIKPDRSPYGNDVVKVTVEKFDNAGKILLAYENTYSHWSDSSKMPALNRTYHYVDGLLVSVIYADGTAQYIANDSRERVIEVKSKEKTEGYRRVYDKDKLIESYYSKNGEPENIIEKLFYDGKGLLSKYETYDKGAVKFTYSFAYDESQKVLMETDNCSTEKYTYNAQGELVEDETLTCSKSLTTIMYAYNFRGLLSSIAKSRSGVSKSETESFEYTYW